MQDGVFLAQVCLQCGAVQSAVVKNAGLVTSKHCTLLVSIP